MVWMIDPFQSKSAFMTLFNIIMNILINLLSETKATVGSTKISIHFSCVQQCRAYKDEKDTFSWSYRVYN